MSNALQVISAQEVANQVGLVQEIMSAVMKPDVHYGKIPGCGDKPTLLQPGAQTLSVAFGLHAETIDEELIDLPNGHLLVRTSIRMLDAQGNIRGEGKSVCSTMEHKYKMRKGNPIPTDQPVPSQYWDLCKTDAAKAQQLLGGKGFGRAKHEGKWVITKGSSEAVEHDNPYDYHNTVRKMGFKRAFVHGVLNATGCSDIFTQDIEEMQAVIRGESAFEVSPAPYDKPEEKKAEKPAAPVEESKPVDKPAEPVKKAEATKEESANAGGLENDPSKILDEKPKDDPEDPKMTDELFAQITGAFMRLSPDLDEDWANKVLPVQKMSDREPFMKVYRAVKDGMVDIGIAINAKTLEDIIGAIK